MEKFIANRISFLLKEKEKKGFRFTPGRAFYEKIGIRQKRWGQIVRNERPATTEEILKVAEYFNFKNVELLELRQTKNIDN